MQEVTIYIATFLLSVSWIVYIKTFYLKFKEIR
jgi:hypothetical protein